MLLRTSRAWNFKMPAIAPRPGTLRRAVLRVAGPAQVVKTIRKELFPKEFCQGMGVLEGSSAQRVKEIHRCAVIPGGAAARGVSNATPASRPL